MHRVKPKPPVWLEPFCYLLILMTCLWVYTYTHRDDCYYWWLDGGGVYVPVSDIQTYTETVDLMGRHDIVKECESD